MQEILRSLEALLCWVGGAWGLVDRILGVQVCSETDGRQ